MSSDPGLFRLLTVNVGLASVYRQQAQRERVMIEWALKAQSDSPPDIVFAQECSEEWLAAWRADYDIVRWDPDSPVYQPKSVVMGRREHVVLAHAGQETVPTLAYHGSYLAAARWVDHPLQPVLMSVHASPNEVEEKYLRHWPGQVPRPLGRFGRKGATTRSTLWDSEMVLATVRDVARSNPVLAAGDLNEARGWDCLARHRGETWGLEFFADLNGPGLVDALHRQWKGVERVTHWNDKERRSLQLDHVLGTARLVAAMREAEVDTSWDSEARCRTAHGSDHAPVWFQLSTE